MLTSKKPGASPLLHILQTQVIPLVERCGAENLIVARPSWKAMQATDEILPKGASLKRRELKSGRTRIRNKQLQGGEVAQVEAHWPEDGLYSRRAPLLGFVIQGLVAIPFGDYNLHCKAGHSFLVLPGTPHSDGSHLLLDDDFLHDGSRKILHMMVRGNGVECWLSRVQQHQHVQPWSAGDNYYIPHPLARQYLETLTDEMTLRRIHFETLGRALMLALVTLLLREIQETRVFQLDLYQRTTLNSRRELSLQEHPPMARAEEYIQNHLQEDLSIDKVAKHLYLSRAYFTRLFRAHTGKTFVEYVTQCRVEEAKVLLHNTEWPVNRIGEVVGLKPSQLRAVFHTFTGVSPSAFRHQSREKDLSAENTSNTAAE